MNDTGLQHQQFADAVADTAALVKLRYAVKDLTFFPRKIAHSQLAGGQRSLFRGRGMDFEEVRHYLPGDDVRAIDWRVTARTHEPYTKVFREERERPVLIITDLRRPMLFGSEDLKASIACQLSTALAWAGIAANDRVGALLFGCKQQLDIRPRRSHHTVLKMIRSLHELCAELPDAQEDHYSLTNIIEESRRIAHPGASVFIVSDFHDLNNDCRKHLYELAKHCDITLCPIHDPLESQLPPPGIYPILANGKRQLLNTNNKVLQKQCKEAFSEREQQLQRLSAELKSGMLSVSTSDSVATLLNQHYGKHRKRRRA